MRWRNPPSSLQLFESTGLLLIFAICLLVYITWYKLYLIRTCLESNRKRYWIHLLPSHLFPRWSFTPLEGIRHWKGNTRKKRRKEEKERWSSSKKGNWGNSWRVGSFPALLHACMIDSSSMRPLFLSSFSPLLPFLSSINLLPIFLPSSLLFSCLIYLSQSSNSCLSSSPPASSRSSPRFTPCDRFQR